MAMMQKLESAQILTNGEEGRQHNDKVPVQYTLGEHTATVGSETIPVLEEMPSRAGVQLIQRLMQRGLITYAQLQQALCLQRQYKPSKPLGRILLEDLKAITVEQLNACLDLDPQRLRCGELLVGAHIITREQLENALQHQKRTGLPLGKTLLQLHYVREDVLKETLSKQLHIPFVDLRQTKLDHRLVRFLNKSYAQKHLIVPVSHDGTILTLAMDDPTDTQVIEDLQSSTGYTIQVVTSSHADIRQAFARLYKDAVTDDSAIAESLELMTDEPPETLGKLKYVEDSQQNQHADGIVRELIGMAITYGASDIHLNPVDHHLQVRFRIDGVLQDLYLGYLEEAIHAHQAAIVSRIKVLGTLDITEKRRPQDGSFRVQVGKHDEPVKIDFRISIVPGHYGESVVLRVLDPRNAPRSIAQLGFSPHIDATFLQLLQRTTGLILITGPTGSGKSTTLYAALTTLYRPGIKVLTAEDPVEYVYDEFTQCEVDEKLGNTFAHYLRAFLRHDPEVIMVGEIRDEETAEMAFRAAQTGHLVLSTLHTNDAISSVTRLLDLHVDANLITSSLLGVLSQRLVRKICPACQAAYEPASALVREFFGEPPADMRWVKGTGCAHCHYTGYKGRLVIGELWVPSDDDVVRINKGAPFDEIRLGSYASTWRMAYDALAKLREGTTNLEEFIRMLPYTCLHQFRTPCVTERPAI
jgi:type IV pilus assembly protein PilB